MYTVKQKLKGDRFRRFSYIKYNHPCIRSLFIRSWNSNPLSSFRAEKKSKINFQSKINILNTVRIYI